MASSIVQIKSYVDLYFYFRAWISSEFQCGRSIGFLKKKIGFNVVDFFVFASLYVISLTAYLKLCLKDKAFRTKDHVELCKTICPRLNVRILLKTIFATKISNETTFTFAILTNSMRKLENYPKINTFFKNV